MLKAFRNGATSKWTVFAAKLRGLDAPTDPTDAANKAYVDGLTPATPTLAAVLAAGNAASAKITTLTDPSSAQDAATKNYVDTTLFPAIDAQGNKTGSNALSFATSRFVSWNLTGNTTISGITAPHVGAFQLFVSSGGSFTLTWPAGTNVVGSAPVQPLSGSAFYNMFWDGTTFWVQQATGWVTL